MAQSEIGSSIYHRGAQHMLGDCNPRGVSPTPPFAGAIELSSSSDHHYSTQDPSDESLEDFERICLRLSPSPPPSLPRVSARVVFNVMDVQDASSTLSSALDAPVFTPPSVGEAEFDDQVMEDLIGPGNNLDLSPISYDASLVISSPSDAAGGTSDGFASGNDEPDSPSVYRPTIREHLHASILHGNMSTPYWSDQTLLDMDTDTSDQQNAGIPQNVPDAASAHMGSAELIGLHQYDYHPAIQTQGLRLYRQDDSMLLDSSSQFQQNPLLWDQETHHGFMPFQHQFSPNPHGMRQPNHQHVIMPSAYRGVDNATLYNQFDPSLASQAIDPSLPNDQYVYSPFLGEHSSFETTPRNFALQHIPQSQTNSIKNRQIIPRRGQEQSTGLSRVRRSTRATPSAQILANELLRNSPLSGSSSASSPPHSISSPDSSDRSKRRGGRRGGLEKAARQETANMRGNACWHCAIDREKCSMGNPCKRCARMSNNSKARVLGGCDRTQFGNDMMPKFIPKSMDPKQLYRSILDYLARDLSHRHEIDVPFSIGIGRPFVWQCYEYTPSSMQSSRSLSWTNDGPNNQWHRTYKRSPPLAIKSLTFVVLKAWVSDLVKHNLDDVADMYSWEGHQLRTQVLKLLCSLYEALRRERSLLKGSSLYHVREDLCEVITMVLVTYIMNHAFTIEESLRDMVIRQLSTDNDPQLYSDMLIITTANSQLKFGFSRLRSEMHLKLLNRLQTILKHARYKEWWLSAFVIMLGLSLTLEEYQHLLHIQADSEQAKGEDENTTLRDAQNYCADIDKGFDFLMKLYHLKYSSRYHHEATFPWTEKFSYPAEEEFVEELSELYKQYRLVLLQRKDLTISSHAEDNHVLRLAGRFLTSLKWA